MSTNPKKSQNGKFIFRRYRRTKDGKILDAHDYGYKAWPIPVSGKPKKK